MKHSKSLVVSSVHVCTKRYQLINLTSLYKALNINCQIIQIAAHRKTHDHGQSKKLFETFHQ